MAAVVPATARQFGRAIIMPNLKPPVTTTAQALAYRERILAALTAGADFQPLMTLYLTDNSAPQEIAAARAAGVVAVKLYPAGATTNSDAGVTDLRHCHETLDMMQREGLLDLDNRKGKAPGAFCTEFPVAKRPFIFINSVGLRDDVRTMLHESGHAFHVFETLHLPYIQQLNITKI